MILLDLLEQLIMNKLAPDPLFGFLNINQWFEVLGARANI